MLNLFRKHASSWLIKIALFLIVIVFIFWGGYSYQSRQESQMARVDDHYISINEYNQSYTQLIELYRRQLGNAFSEDFIRQLNLKKRALDLLIDRYVVSKAAEELGLNASLQEIQQQVLQFPVFQTDGKFDKKRYLSVLQQNRLTPEAFERNLAQDLAAEKLENFIKRQAVVTDEEVLADYRFNYGTIQLAYVILDPKSYEDKVTTDDKSLESFFQERQDRYKDPEKRQIVYVLFKADDYSGGIQVTDDEIRRKYEENKSEYHHEKEVQARHILFSVKEDAPEAEVEKVRAEAQKVLEEAGKGKDFAELAKKYSKDPGSAEKGGDLGYFAKDRMVPAFSDAAFGLKPGQISELVRTPFGFHIIKVEGVRPEKTDSLEDVRSQIEASLKEEKAGDIAYEKARNFSDLAYAQKDITKAAEAQKLQLMGGDKWLGPNDLLPGLETVNPEIANKLFALPEKEISETLQIPKGFLVAQVQGIQAPQVPPFEKVKDRVEKDYKMERARQAARQKASELLGAAKKSTSLEEAAKEQKLDVRKSGWFSRRNPENDLKLLQGEALSTLFQLQESQSLPDEPLNLGNRFIVVQLLGKKEPDEGLDKERDSIRKRLAEQKQDALWQTWLQEQRGKAQVEIYKEL